MSSVAAKSTTVANPSYAPQTYSQTGYRSFASFYPYYLGEHSNSTCLIGTTISLSFLTRAALASLPLLLTLKSKDAQRRLDILRFGTEGWKSIVKLVLGGVAQGYVWAWIGHFFYEKNRPATFKHPFYSFLGDLTLWKEVVTLQRRL
ncbi:hypothetical protein JCM6882_008866 [Rhodosporidiobolus microsporus]